MKLLAVLVCGLFSVFAQVRFDAAFESGNLNTVSTTDSVTYTVTTKQDIGGRWFYFRMSNVRNRFVRVRVSSSDVKRAMYSYDNRIWTRFTASESPATNQFEKTYASDTVYAAYYIPYTLTYLKQRLQDWKTHPAVRIDTIGFTARNLPLYELTVTDTAIADSTKHHIWIHARTHPSETPTSRHFEGVMATLLGNDPVVKYYLRRLVFHCIPFTNPDGVYYGKSRTNFDGVDVEADWAKADSVTCKEVLVLKQRMRSIANTNPFQVFLNLHSQAAPYCTFWIHTAASTTNRFYLREMQFSNINTSDNPYFVPSDYSFSALQAKFPEGWLWANHGEKVMALTYETPYDYYSNNTVVTDENLSYLGERTVYSIGEYLEYSHPGRMLLTAPEVPAGWQRDTAGTSFFGKAFWKTTGGSGADDVVFNAGIMLPGIYAVSIWYPAFTTNAADARITLLSTGQNETKLIDQRSGGAAWKQIGTVQSNGLQQTSIRFSSNAAGFVVANAVRLVYIGPYTGADNNSFLNDYRLEQNFPNPFNPTTTIRFSLPSKQFVTLGVYDMLGREVAVLVNSETASGTHEVVFDSKGLSSGVYIYRLNAGGAITSKKMTLLK